MRTHIGLRTTNWTSRTGRGVAGVLVCAALLIPSALAAAAPASAAVTVTSHFVWTATSSNDNGGITVINNGATNGAPNALLFVTPTYDPGGVCGCVSEPGPLVAIWAPGYKKWAIWDLSGSGVPVGASFNVLVVQRPTSYVFRHTTTSQNTTANGTTIYSTAINGNSHALLQVTEVLPNGLSCCGDAHSIGVVYGLGAGGNQWDIQNVDNAAMPVGVSFNVMVGAGQSNGGTAALLTGTSSNTFGSDTFVSSAETTGNPNAVVFEIQNADPGFHFGSGDVAPTGVIYISSPRDVLAVANENGKAMPTTAHYFNLLIFPS